jgi:hypothetical protein
MTSVHQSKLVGEPLAVLDQGLGQYEPATIHQQLEQSSAPHSGAQGWADIPETTTVASKSLAGAAARPLRVREITRWVGGQFQGEKYVFLLM